MLASLTENWVLSLLSCGLIRLFLATSNATKKDVFLGLFNQVYEEVDELSARRQSATSCLLLKESCFVCIFYCLLIYKNTKHSQENMPRIVTGKLDGTALPTISACDTLTP